MFCLFLWHNHHKTRETTGSSSAAVDVDKRNEWGNKLFSDRIRQEIKRNKYFHYLDIKRKLKLHGKTKKEINQILKTTGGKMEEVDKVLIEDDVRRKLKLKGKTKKDIDKILEEWGGNMEEIDKILNEMDVDSGACDL